MANEHVDPAQLMAYLHGELDAAEARRIARRLETDVELRAEFEALQRVSQQLERTLSEPASEGLDAHHLRTIQSAASPHRRWTYYGGALAAASLAGIVWVSVRQSVDHETKRANQYTEARPPAPEPLAAPPSIVSAPTQPPAAPKALAKKQAPAGKVGTGGYGSSVETRAIAPSRERHDSADSALPVERKAKEAPSAAADSRLSLAPPMDRAESMSDESVAMGQLRFDRKGSSIPSDISEKALARFASEHLEPAVNACVSRGVVIDLDVSPQGEVTGVRVADSSIAACVGEKLPNSIPSLRSPHGGRLSLRFKTP